MSIEKFKRDTFEIFKAAVEAANPVKALKNSVKVSNGKIHVLGYQYNLNKYENIYVVGGGKASGLMAQTIEEILGGKITRGHVNVLKGTKRNYKTRVIELNEASHPIPDLQGLTGARKILETAMEAGERDLVISLISGGGSALITMPSEGVSLEDVKETTNLLLKAGATINELNSVRKHISQVKGGQLAKAAYPAEMLNLIVSDVVGDPLDVIASGPTSPDTTTFQEAKNVLLKYNLWSKVPKSVSKRIEMGVKGLIPETPKPGEKIFRRVRNIVIANNRLAVEAAAKKAEELGYNAAVLSCYIEGEARHVGTVIGAIALEINKYNSPFKKPVAVLGGGETTVTVKGKGKGGRNQELVLGAALKIKGEKNLAVASMGTDGIDGNSEAAGAIAHGETVERALEKGMNPVSYLEENDSYTFFKELGDLIVTGPTGTNVNDITCIIVGSTTQ